MWLAILLSIGVFALIIAGMALGAIFQNKCLRGSCGGPGVFGPNGEDLRCSGCPNREKDDETDAGTAH